jgi:3-oxoacyl-[acyl-carrier-protein] synthase II
MPRRVAVTGLGAYTPLGTDVASTWAAALAGTSAARTFDTDWKDRYGISVDFACQVAGDPVDRMPKHEIKKLDPSTVYAMLSAEEAWADTGAPEVDPLRLATSYGTGIGGVWTLLDQWDAVRDRGARRVSPLTVPMLMANSTAGQVSLKYGARAAAVTAVSACASGAEAVGNAAAMILRDEADMVIAGGTEAAVHPLPMAAFANMRALSTRVDDPARASRPYDRDRDGFVMGEGAATLVLEDEEHARARGATIYAYVTGWGLSADAHNIVAPDPVGAGAQRAMEAALQASGLSPQDIVHVNAHATSTPAGDIAETQAIRRALSGRADQVVVSGTKSMTGHLLGGAGALESLFTVLALRDRVAPPTINVENLDPEVQLDVAVGEKRALAPTGDLAAMNNAFGFGGHNAATVFTSA